MTATTALTAQNTQGVSAIHRIPPDFVVKQIDACISDLGVDVVKIGMLASAETVDAVTGALREHGTPLTVLDPVMVATSGAQLLPNDAVTNLRTNLLPLATILTPNIPEARLLLQNANKDPPEINSIDDIVHIAKQLQCLGPTHVLVKGGHLPLAKDGRISKEDADHRSVVDVLWNGVEAALFETEYSRSNNTHGTGCSLACTRPFFALIMLKSYSLESLTLFIILFSTALTDMRSQLPWRATSHSLPLLTKNDPCTTLSYPTLLKTQSNISKPA